MGLHGPLGDSLGHVMPLRGGEEKRARGSQGTSLGPVMPGKGGERRGGNLSRPRCAGKGGRGEEGVL